MIKSISPVTVFPDTASKLRVDDVLVVLSQSANCQYALLSEEGRVLGAPGRVILNGEDYQNWGSSDDYVFAFVANKLGVTITPDE